MMDLEEFNALSNSVRKEKRKIVGKECLEKGKKRNSFSFL